LEGEAANVGLKMNEQKTKYMIATRIDTTICDVRQSVANGDKRGPNHVMFHLNSVMLTNKTILISHLLSKSLTSPARKTLVLITFYKLIEVFQNMSCQSFITFLITISNSKK
jgi:hypothetical protein